MTYDQFLETVTNGKTEVSVSSQKKMPAFGTNPNVMCFIDDIYAYLKARADGALERGRPQHVDKPEDAKTRDDACLGSSQQRGRHLHCRTAIRSDGLGPNH